MRYQLGLVSGHHVIGTVGGDGSIHPHSTQTRIAGAVETAGDGHIIARPGDAVRVPHPLEDPAHHCKDGSNPAEGVELALLTDTDDGPAIVARFGGDSGADALAAIEHANKRIAQLENRVAELLRPVTSGGVGG